MPKLDNAGESTSIRISKGVYASLGTVSKVTDLSNHPDHPRKEPLLRNDGTPVQICLEVTYEREDGAEWNTRLYGDYKIDQVTGKVKGWKAFGNGVQDFFDKLLGREVLENTLNDDYSMSPALFNLLIGKSFYKISYISGFNKKNPTKGAYKDFNQVFLPETTIEEMQKAWASSAPYMKTYKPDVIDELERIREEAKSGDTSFDYGANADDAPIEDNEEFEL